MSIGINKFNFFHIKTDDFYNDKHIFLYSISSHLLFWTFTLIFCERSSAFSFLNVHMFARIYQRSQFSISLYL